MKEKVELNEENLAVIAEQLQQMKDAGIPLTKSLDEVLKEGMERYKNTLKELSTE